MLPFPPSIEAGHLPIGRIPNEILLEIFFQLVQEVREDYENLDNNDEQYPYSWLTLTHVCRRWRGVALQNAKLWRWIVPIRTDMAEEFMRRSGIVNLIVPRRRYRAPYLSDRWIRDNLVLGKDDKVATMEALGTLCREFHRIERIVLYADLASPDISVHPVSESTALQFLTVLSPHCLDRYDMVHYLAGLPLSRLETLRCILDGYHDHAILALFRPTLASLTVTVKYSFGYPPLARRKSFLDALENLGCLEHLYLEGTEGLFGLALSTPTRRVTLPRLRKFHATDCRNGASAVSSAAHLIFPSHTRVRVTVKGSTSCPFEQRILFALFQLKPSLHDPANQLSMSLNYDSPVQPAEVQINVWRTTPHILDTPCYEQWGAPELTYATPLINMPKLDLAFQIFGASRVTVLHVTCGMSFREWRHCFRTFASLRSLTVSAEASSALDALIPQIDEPYRLFPSLKKLTMDRVCWQTDPDPILHFHPSDVAVSLVDALAQRGAGIEQLVISNAELLAAEDVEYIRDHTDVPEVVWDLLETTLQKVSVHLPECLDCAVPRKSS